MFEVKKRRKKNQQHSKTEKSNIQIQLNEEIKEYGFYFLLKINVRNVAVSFLDKSKQQQQKQIHKTCFSRFFLISSCFSIANN